MIDTSPSSEEQNAAHDFAVQRYIQREGAPLNLLIDRITLADQEDLNEQEKQFLLGQLKQDRVCRVVRSDGSTQSGFISNLLPSHRRVELTFWDERKQKPQTKLVALDEYLGWQEGWALDSGEQVDSSDEETVK